MKRLANQSRRQVQRQTQHQSQSQSQSQSRNAFVATIGAVLGMGLGALGTWVYVKQDARTTQPKPATLPPQKGPAKQPTWVTTRSHEALRYGLPSTNNVFVRSGYVVSYDYRTRNASWVMEYLTKDSLQADDETDRAKSNFTADKDTPEIFRVHPSVYLKTGYDKGHLAPARDMSNSQEAMNESFLMTNISPQVGVGFNRSYWSRFEGFVRHLANLFDGLYVITGPLFLPTKNKRTGEHTVTYPVIGTPPDAVAVPTHFFKVVLGRHANGNFAVAGFILPNKAIPDKKDLREFLVPIAVIEKYSGLLFFDQLLHVNKRELCSETQCSLVANNFKKHVK